MPQHESIETIRGYFNELACTCGKPTDNGLCESFNGRLRDECLNVHEFKTIEEAKRIIEK